MFFQRAAARFCAPVDDVQAIAEIGEVHSLPFCRKGIAGVFMFRERMALLCDPGAALALESAGEDASAKLAIVVAFPEGMVAFRVDSVSEIVPARDLKRPAGERNALTEWMDGYAMQGSDIAFLTTFDKLMRLLLDADLAALIGSAAVVVADLASRDSAKASAATGASPPPPAVASKIEAAPAAQRASAATAAAKPASTVSPSASQPAVARAQPTSVPARAWVAKTRPARVGPTRAPTHVQIAASYLEPREPDPVEPEALPEEQVEPNPPSEPYFARVDSSEAQPSSSLSMADTAKTGGPPLTTVLPAPAQTVREAQAISTPAPPAPSSDREPVKRRWVLPAAVASTLLALALGILLLSERETGKLERLQRAAAPVATVARPDPPSSSPRPAEIAIVGKDFELRVERGAANPPAPSPATVTEPSAPVAAPSRPGARAVQSLPSRTEIRHVVVRGDTLWAIATRYLGNPYRYPELAHDSRIRNPDLIYPGDVVIIVRRR